MATRAGRSDGSRSKRSWGIGLGLLLLVGFFGWLILRPIDGDKLCSLVRASYFSCPTLVADPVTLRPGGVVREVQDHANEQFTRLELPNAYLDNDSCLIPGAKLTPWSPQDEKSFDLPTIAYDFNVLTKVGAKLTLPNVQGVEIDTNAAASRLARISISFGPTRTRLLDENVLLNRIESCEISPRCIDRIRQHGYKVLNRIVEVEGMNYSFEDSQGVRIPLGVLLDSKILKGPTANFEVHQRTASTLNSKTRLVIGLSTINSEAIAKAKPCTEDVVYSSEGGGRAVIGGGGRPGHIIPRAPVFAKLGDRAEISAQGSEGSRGNFERTVSFAKGAASVAQVSPDTLQILNSVAVQGGHYGVRGPAGIGIVSGHDTSANAEATADGRINILLRRPGADLLVEWQGFPTSRPVGIQQDYAIQVTGPGGVVDEIRAPIGSGERKLRLPAEGYYAVIVKAFSRAEGSGHAARSGLDVKAVVRARVQPGPS